MGATSSIVIWMCLIVHTVVNGLFLVAGVISDTEARRCTAVKRHLMRGVVLFQALEASATQIICHFLYLTLAVI